MMPTLRAVLAALAMPLLLAATAAAQTPEIRGVWISRFEWPNSNQTTAKNNIDTIMATAKANNFNSVFFQVRGDCTAHYPSPDEPWANTYGYSNPGWDPLAYAISSAHAQGLKFHAYINSHTMVSGASAPPNTTPQHKYHTNGPNVAPVDSWVIRDIDGVAAATDSYWWISPGHPGASEWTRRQIMHVVKNYDVDGVHLDRIRTPGVGYSYDPTTVARFNGDGNPDNLGWADFMRSQITRDVRNLYGEIQYHKPNVLLSAAPFGIMYKDATTNYQGFGTQAYHEWYQDAYGWLAAGAMDFMVPQIYWNVGSSHPYELLLADWMNNRHGRYIVPGSTTGSGSETLANLLLEVQESRNQNAWGHVIFSYGSMGAYWAGYKAGPYAQPAPVPDMPWKSSPTTGNIIGHVKDLQGNPVLDAKVNRAGEATNYLSAADGFFSILNVPPGSAHSVSAVKAGKGSGVVSSISVTAGNTTFILITLGLQRGELTLDKASYGFGELVRIGLEDEDLTAAPTAQVHVATNSHPAGTTVTLNATSPGVFAGSVELRLPADNGGTGVLPASTGDTLTATYPDADVGGGVPDVAVRTASITAPGNVVVESRLPSAQGGGVTPSPTYVEYGPPASAGWANTTAKSAAPGLTAPGSRYIGDNGMGAYYIFRPDVLSRGYYDVAITIGAPSSNIHSPGAGYLVQRPGHPDLSGTFDLSKDTPGMVSDWYVLESEVLFERGTDATIRITNNHAGSAGTGNRFVSDAVRLSFSRGAPVELGSFSVE